MPCLKLRCNLSHIFFIFDCYVIVYKTMYIVLKITPLHRGKTTNRALSGCVQNYQHLENIYVIKIQCNIEILKENYSNFTYILPITIVNSKSFIKRLEMFESEYHIKCVYNLKQTVFNKHVSK